MLRRALKRVKKGFYVDVGAQDPVRDSVSKAFYEMGWHGINIEPVSVWFEKLSADRPRDINLRVAASSSDGDVTLYEVKDSGLSTMDVDYAKHYSDDGMEVVEHSVQTRTLSSILADAAVQEIHFLKVDVEGAEESVLRGMDFSEYRPWIILVEARLPNSTRDAFRSWESLIVSAGYTFAWDDGLNRFYYANEHSRLARAFKLPPNVFDQFVTYDESHLSDLSRWAHELEAKLAQAEASMYQSNLQLADAFEQLGRIKDERRVADTELLGLHAQVGDLLAQLGDASHASAQDAKTIASLNDEIAQWKEQQAGLREQSKNLQSRYEEALNDNDHLRRARQGLMEEVSRKAQEIALTEREAAAVAQLLAARIAEVERLYRSRSWRLTSPLRRVSGLLGAFRRRGVSGTIGLIALRHSSSAGREKMDSCADGKSSLPKTTPTIQDVLLSKHIEALEGVRRKIRQRLDDDHKGR